MITATPKDNRPKPEKLLITKQMVPCLIADPDGQHIGLVIGVYSEKDRPEDETKVRVVWLHRVTGNKDIVTHRLYELRNARYQFLPKDIEVVIKNP